MSKLREIIFSNNSSKQILFKNTFWLSFVEVSSKLIMFFVTIWIVRYLGPSLFGKYNVAISLVSVFTIFSDLGVGFVMTRDIAKNKNVSSEYLSNTFGIRIFTTIFIILISLIASIFIHDSELVIIFLLAIIHNSILQFQGLINNVLVAHEKMEYIFVVKIFYYLGLLLSTFIVVNFKINLSILLILYCLVTVFSIFIALIILSKLKIQIKISFNFLFWKKIIIQSLPIFGFIACSQIYSNVDTLLIRNFYNNESVGLYQSAYKILFAFQSINIINSVLFPRITSLIHNDKPDSLNKITNWVVIFSLLIIVPTAIIISIFSSQIISLIYGHQYNNASTILTLLIWSGVFNYFRVMSTNFLMAKEKQNKIFFAMLIGLIVNIILNVTLLPKYGVIFAAINLVLTEAIILFLTIYFQKNNK